MPFVAMHQNRIPAPDKLFLTSIYAAALKPTLPAQALKEFEPPSVAGTIYLFAAGKAATQMAAAIYPKLSSLRGGIVVTRSGYAQPDFHPDNLDIIEASHPVPDTVGLAAAERAMREIGELGEDDLLLALISGGASSLLPLPVGGVSLTEKQAVTRQLLHCGAPISEMNIVRKHLSAIKGGRLAAAAYPARTQMIGISDVPGDDLGTIGSGPTVADRSTLSEAQEIVARYELQLPVSVVFALANRANETPKPEDVKLSRSEASLCATPEQLVMAAAQYLQSKGYEPQVLGDDLEGDAILMGQDHAALAIQAKSKGRKIAIISGGEATVRVTNPKGRGGRNTAFLLSCAIALNGESGITGFAADTDGIDGSEDHAGAFLWPELLPMIGGSAAATDFLASDCSYTAFQRADALMITGPSGTNVNDLRVLLVG